MPNPRKEYEIHTRIGQEGMERLEFLTKRFELTPSAILRVALREFYERHKDSRTLLP